MNSILDEMTNKSQIDALYRKVTLRLIPVLLVAFIASYLDRVNIGFAKLQMQNDLGFSDFVYGLGAGIFFIGYFIFEVPSNIILHRIGAKIWITRIMITWGIISALNAFVTTEFQFYLVRFLLGVAEAGFFPGIILYLTYWYPSERRGRVTSLFISAVAIAGIIGGPVSGFILKQFEGLLGWRGWQWLYVLEALPSLFLGLVIFFFLTNRISDAKWLSQDEKNLLIRVMERDEAIKDKSSTWSFIKNPRVWHLSLVDFCLVMGLYGISFWLPSLINDMGAQDDVTIGLLSGIPWAAGILSMIAIGISSDRSGERRWHLAGSSLVGSLGLFLAVYFNSSHKLEFAAIILATMGITAALPIFWTLPTGFLSGATAAGGIALINSIANLAGFISPFAVGWISTETGSKANGMLLLSAALLIGSLLTISLPVTLKRKNESNSIHDLR